MALLNRKIRKGKEYPKRVCFLDNIDTDDLKIIKPEKLGLPVVEREANNNEKDFVTLSHTVYILKDFQNNQILETLQKTPNVIVMGVTAVAEFVLNPNLEFRSQPLFCTSMIGMCFYIDRAYLHQSTAERMVKLIKWMGGMFCLQPMRHTTHMVTTSTLSEEYIYCSTFNVPIVRPEWVEECWKNRELVGNKAEWCLKEYHIKSFQGLYMCLKGFKEVQELLSAIEENGGTVVPVEDQDCTHLIVPNVLSKHINIEDVPVHVVFVVSEEWLYNSIEYKFRVDETDFSCYKPTDILKNRRSKKKEIKDSEESGDTGESLAEDGFIDQAVENSPEGETEKEKKRNEKREFIYKELCDTEKNYLECLQHLVRLQELSTEPREPILSQIESKIIFSNLEHLLTIHKQINEQLIKGLKNWLGDKNQPVAGVGALDIFVQLKNKLLKEYVTYSNSFEELHKMLKQCEVNSLPFQTLLRTWKIKIKIKGDHHNLFIRPIQRLASISLLLKELNNNTDNEDSNKQLVLDVIDIVTSILQLMNDRKAECQEQEQLFDIYNQIEDCPPNVVAHQRKFIDQIFVIEITDKSQSTGANLMLFLFNDVIEVAKVKSKKQDTLKKLNKAGQVSTQKTYKHVELIPLQTITHVLIFANNESNSQIFGFNLRDKENGGKKIYCFSYYGDEEHFETKIENISKYLYINNRTNSFKNLEDYVIRDIPPQRLSIDAVYTHNSETQRSALMNMASKAVRSVMKKKPKPRNRRRSSSCSNAPGLHLAL